MPVADITSRAVFLSYASQDADAAKSICDALRAAGIEVWFDQSELRAGDAWDQKIRRELHDCALFMPIISANTAARHEGYFRLEWDVADQRTHMIARNRAFIVPVCVDGTRETSADLPESFQRVQWTWLPGGETPAIFVERIQRLLSVETGSAPERAGIPGNPGNPAILVSPVTPAGAATGVPPPPAVGTDKLVRGRGRRLAYAVSAAAFLAIAYFVLERITAPGAAAHASNSIAVLPLVNESGDANEQYFSDGISEDLITALAQFHGLKVIGRTSSFLFRDSKEDSRSIGTQLGVAHLLVGSVRRSGDMIRVHAELIDTGDASTEWSELYDRPYQDLFALQDEITRTVAGALKAKLLPGDHAAMQSERPPSGSLEAYNAFLQGRFYFSRLTAADYRKAIEAYTQAVGLDPRYAVAWSELSFTWTWLGSEFLAGTPAQRDAYAKAREAAERALTLSPDLAAAHVARGLLLQSADFDWRGAEAEFRRALALAPNDSVAKFYLGTQLATFGEVKPAIELTRQALATDPLRAVWYYYLASYLSGLNRLDEAEQAVRRAIELQPAAAGFHQTLAIIEIQRGNAQAALDAAQGETHRGYRNSAIAMARQIAGDRKGADAALRLLIDEDANIMSYAIAEVYALRMDPKEMFEWLDRAWSNRDGDIGGLLYDPFILRYKDDPRFAAFCRKAGLPAIGLQPRAAVP